MDNEIKTKQIFALRKKTLVQRVTTSKEKIIESEVIVRRSHHNIHLTSTVGGTLSQTTDSNTFKSIQLFLKSLFSKH